MKKKINFITSLFGKKVFLTIDVGCDHGYLSIALLNYNKSDYVINIDNKNAPLQSAIKNTKKSLFKNHIINILNEGLSNLPNELNPDVIVIAGIGGRQIIEILKNSTIHNFGKLILQSEGNLFKLRKWLLNNNYQIFNEHIWASNNTFYVFIECKKIKFNEVSYTYADYEIGPILKNKIINNELIKKFYWNEIDCLEKIPYKYLNEEKNIKLNFLKKFMAEL